MAALVSRILWPHFYTVAGSEDVSVIFVCVILGVPIGFVDSKKKNRMVTIISSSIIVVAV